MLGKAARQAFFFHNSLASGNTTNLKSEEWGGFGDGKIYFKF